jgi:hypothetical protein
MSEKIIAALAVLSAAVAFADVPELTVGYADGDNADFSPALSWTAVDSPLTLQRAEWADGAFADIATLEPNVGTYNDDSVPVGVPCRYRLVSGEEAGEPVEFRRIGKISVPMESVFWTGVDKTQGWYNEGTYAFDGDTTTHPDLADGKVGVSKVGVDFGRPMPHVAIVRIHTRPDNHSDRVSGTVAYGSMRSGEALKVSANADLDTPITDPLPAVGANVNAWFQMPVVGPEAYRSYYLTATNGNLSEVEFYGWREQFAVETELVEVDECTAVLSPKLSWFASSQVTVQRSESDEGPWTDVAEFPAGIGSWLDTPVPAGKVRWYRVTDGERSGAPVRVIGVRKLSTDGYTVISDGNFTVSTWGKPPSNAFSGNLVRDSYPDGDPKHSPKIGIDFGKATNHVAWARAFPRFLNNAQGRMNGLVIHGIDEGFNSNTTNDVETWTSSGTQLSLPLHGVSAIKWYSIPVDASKAYRAYYFDGAENGNVVELEFYGWAESDIEAAASVADPVEPMLRLSFDMSSGTPEKPRVAYVVGGMLNGKAKLQRATYEYGPWTTIAEGLNGVGTVEDNSLSVPYGTKLFYRVVTDDASSNVLATYKMRRLEVDTAQVFGPTRDDVPPSSWYNSGSVAMFDGNLNTYGDYPYSHYRAGVDFGEATNFVAHMRIYPRHDADYRARVRDVMFSGSDFSGERIMGDEYLDSFGTELTDPCVDKYGYLGWYDLPVANPAAYRTYFISRWSNNGFYGNIAELQLYGWTADDIGESVSGDLHVRMLYAPDGNGVYRPNLVWNGFDLPEGTTVVVQRAATMYGPWEDFSGELSEGATEYVDVSESVVGKAFAYRLKISAGDDVSYSDAFKGAGIKKISTEGQEIFFFGTPWADSDDIKGPVAFDGNINTYTDFNLPSKVGVDFGAATNHLSLVRVYPRNNYLHRLNGVSVYGSNDDAGKEGSDADTTGDAVLCPAFSSITALKWYQFTMSDDATAYRTFYLSGFTEYSNVAECEFYGWQDAGLSVSGVTNETGIVLTASGIGLADGDSVTFGVVYVGPGVEPDFANATTYTVTVADGEATQTVEAVFGARAVFYVKKGDDYASGELIVNDNAGYGWKPDATGEKLWEDPANWNCWANDGKRHLGYPGYLDTGSANVSFNDAGDVSVSLSATYTVREFWIDGSTQKTISFHGNGADTSGIVCGNGTFVLGTNKNITFDAMSFSSNNARLRDNVEMTLSNGAKFSVVWWFYVTGENAVLHVDADSWLETSWVPNLPWWGLMLNGKDAWIDLEGKITAPRVRIGVTNDDDKPGVVQNYTPKGITFRGKSPLLECKYELVCMNSFGDEKVPVFEFIVPEHGYAEPPVRTDSQKTSDIAFQMFGSHYQGWSDPIIGSDAKVAFHVSTDSPVYGKLAERGIDMPLVHWPVYNSSSLGGGIERSRVVLMRNATASKPSDFTYGYDADNNATAIFLRIDKSRGTSVTVR